ncbi:ABC transporter ATP-binding protein [Nocardiopsis sp. CA-288880]|uniref:ABC transporter ATP-binding protein n=1 Tax=Nocardiopsis sp. CA-288880 TaxID=3239995 RepID=UPI003D95B923
MSSLELRGLGARYGRKTALRGLDAEIADGEFFVVLGPSGAGKTTTLKCVAGLVEGATGAVLIGGRDMTGVEPYERNVAMAFESYALYPQKTVAENLASPLRSGRLGTWTPEQRSARVGEVTRTLGIDHLLGRYPRELSNGQRQRTALGRVLVRPADVYLLDEPLSHLDAKLRAAMRAELKQLSGMARTTTVYVTHDYQEALALGDRVGVLREGRLVQVGTPAQVWETPADAFVARTLGQPETNLLEARVHRGLATTHGGGATVALPEEAHGADGVLLGLRPRDLRIAGPSVPPDGAGRELVMRGRVVLAERLGRSRELSVDVAGQTVITVTDDPRVREGDDVALAVEWGRVHVFAGRAGDGSPYPPRVGSALPVGGTR